LVAILFLELLHPMAAVAVLMVAAVLALQRQAVLEVVAARQLLHRQGQRELLDKVLLVAVVDLRLQTTRLRAAAALVLLA
jgi:hypothetical protein